MFGLLYHIITLFVNDLYKIFSKKFYFLYISCLGKDKKSVYNVIMVWYLNFGRIRSQFIT